MLFRSDDYEYELVDRNDVPEPEPEVVEPESVEASESEPEVEDILDAITDSGDASDE